MATGDPVVAEVIKSGAVLWNAPVGEANPDETSVAFGADWGGNWERNGFTAAPLLLIYESEEYDIEVEEELGPIKRRRIKENERLETIMAQLTAKYKELAAGGQDTVTEQAAGVGQAGYEEAGFGGECILEERKWGFEGMFLASDGNQFPIRLFIHIATTMINGNLEFSKKSTTQTGIPVQIKALTDTSQSVGRKFHLFQRVTAAATS